MAGQRAIPTPGIKCLLFSCVLCIFSFTLVSAPKPNASTWSADLFAWVTGNEHANRRLMWSVDEIVVIRILWESFYSPLIRKLFLYASRVPHREDIYFIFHFREFSLHISRSPDIQAVIVSSFGNYTILVCQQYPLTGAGRTFHKIETETSKLLFEHSLFGKWSGCLLCAPRRVFNCSLFCFSISNADCAKKYALLHFQVERKVDWNVILWECRVPSADMYHHHRRMPCIHMWAATKRSRTHLNLCTRVCCQSRPRTQPLSVAKNSCDFWVFRECGTCVCWLLVSRCYICLR